MGTRNNSSKLRHITSGIAIVAVTALATGCSANAPTASASPSASATATAVTIASGVPLEDQLYDALRAGDVPLTSALLAAGANVDAPLDHGSTAIGIAVIRDEPQLVAAVLAAHPNLAVLDSAGMPLLNAACKQGVSGEVMELLIDAGAQIDSESPDNVGSLPIHECAYSGSSDAIDVLLKHGVDVNARQPKYGGTPLIVAAWQGHGELVQHLLDLGADPTLVTDNGATARKWALVGGHDDVAAMLQQVGG